MEHKEFQKYLETDNIPRHKTVIETIYQGSETPAFKKFFKTWDDKLFTTVNFYFFLKNIQYEILKMQIRMAINETNQILIHSFIYQFCRCS